MTMPISALGSLWMDKHDTGALNLPYQYFTIQHLGIFLDYYEVVDFGLSEEKQTIRDFVEKYLIPVVESASSISYLRMRWVAKSDLARRSKWVLVKFKKTTVGQQSTFLDRIPNLAQCLQWHGTEVKCVPAGFDMFDVVLSLQGPGNRILIIWYSVCSITKRLRLL